MPKSSLIGLTTSRISNTQPIMVANSGPPSTSSTTCKIEVSVTFTASFFKSIFIYFNYFSCDLSWARYQTAVGSGSPEMQQHPALVRGMVVRSCIHRHGWMVSEPTTYVQFFVFQHMERTFNNSSYNQLPSYLFIYSVVEPV